MRKLCGWNKSVHIGLIILFIPVLLCAQSHDSVKTRYGWVEFESNADSLYVVADGHFRNALLITSGDSLKFKQGDYHFTFVNPHYWDEYLPIQVIANEKLTFLVTFRHKIWRDHNRSGYKRITDGISYNLTLTTDPGSTIIIDDSTYGKHFIRTDVGPGYHTILVKHPTAIDRKKRIHIEPSGQLNLHFYDRPSKTVSHLLSILPGASQLYKNQKLKGVLLMAGTAGVFAFSAGTVLRYNQTRSDYNNIHKLYEAGTNEVMVKQYGLEAQHENKLMRSAAKMRNIAFSSALGLYIINIIDAYLSVPRSGYRFSRRIKPVPVISRNTMSLGIKVSFQ